AKQEVGCMAGHHGADGAENPGGDGPAAWLRYCPAHRADQRRPPLPQLRQHLSGAAAAGAGAGHQLPMGPFREQSQSQVLPADGRGPPAAQTGNRGVAGSFHHRGAVSGREGDAMRAIWRLWARVAGLFAKGKREREMAQEFESHLEMHIEDNMRAGMTREEARREALVKFGGMEAAKESVPQTSRALWVETAWQDVRYALRGLRLNPGFATTAILSLALGIGSSVAIYTVADNLLLRPLPYPEAQQLVMLYETNPHRNFSRNVISPAN